MVRIDRNNPGKIEFFPDRPAVRFAAEQLAYYVALLTGAHPTVREAAAEPVTRAPHCAGGLSLGQAGEPRIVLTLLAAGSTRGHCLGQRNAGNCELRVADQVALLEATSEFALVHGVYKTLEQFGGARWLNRMDGEEHLPRLAALELPEGRLTLEPRFAALAFTNYPHIGPDTADFLDWMAKQGFNQFMVNLAVRGAWETCRDHLLPAARLRGIETTVGHHSFHFWVPPAEFFDVHPDYFALIDGQRRPDAQLCTSNPEVRRLVAERIVEFLRANPEIREVGLWPRDGFGWCQCPDCAAEEPQEPSWWDPAQPRRTDTYLGFVNAVAEAVSEEIPGARISALAYLNYVEPPRDVRPADNVIIYFAPFMRCFKHPLGATECQRRNPKYSELILQWREVAQELRLFAYLMQIDTFSLPYRLTNMLEPNLDFLEQVGVDGWVMEYDVRDWATFSANAYVIAKLSWKTAAQPETLSPAPSRKGEALLRDFLYPALYGPAADDMAEYFSHIAELMVESGPCTGHYDLTWAMRATPEYLRPALAALGRASAAAARDRKAWSAVRRAAASVEFLLRVGRWQRALADLREASEYTRKRKMELACWAADQVVEWAEGHSDLGIINAPKIVSRLRREMERWLQAAP